MSFSNGQEPKNPAISVVVPVRNEAGNIAPLVAEIAKALQDRAFEIVYVDDGSADATGDELRGLMRGQPRLRQIRHEKSCGQSAAIRTGVAAARAGVVVTLDGDGQNDPAFIPALIAALEAGAPQIGLIAGQRTGRKATGFKKLQSRIANGVRKAVLKDGTRDTGCGLKAFRREGLAIGYVDVVDRQRRHGVSNYGFFDRLWIGILDLAGVWWLIRRRKRVPQSEEITLAR